MVLGLIGDLNFPIKKEKKKKRFPFECLFGKKIWKVREFFGGKKFNMFMLKIYVIDFIFF